MKVKDIFKQFCIERNIKESTIKGYESAILKYEEFHKTSIEKLLQEASIDEKNKIPLKERRLKNRLISFRSYLINSGMSPNTSKTYFSKLKTFYVHHEIEIPHLPEVKYDKLYEINYLDLPTHEHIAQAIDIVSIDMKAIILFMSSSGTAKAETLSLTVGQFIEATKEYHNGGTIKKVLNSLENKDYIIPTFYLKRIKTNKYYYTFCSPEATKYIIKYLKTRKNLKNKDQLFEFNDALLLTRFQDINDQMNWGFKGNYRFFRTHTLRKFHASNIDLPAEYIDALQGRSKNEVHETYIKTKPEKLKKIYKNVYKNVLIFKKEDKIQEKQEIREEEYHITINIFLGDNQLSL